MPLPASQSTREEHGGHVPLAVVGCDVVDRRQRLVAAEVPRGRRAQLGRAWSRARRARPRRGRGRRSRRPRPGRSRRRSSPVPMTRATSRWYTALAVAPRDQPPFRADHVGSLLRPPELLDARGRRRGGPHRRGRAARDRGHAIRDVVRLQERGRPPVGDRRRVPPRLVAHGLHLRTRRDREGGRAQLRQVLQRGGPDRVHAGRAARRRAARRLRDDLRRRLRVSLPRPSTTTVPKLTIPSPSMVHYRGGRAAIDESVYPDLDAFWADLDRRVRRRGAAARRARLPLPPARRHEPRLPERPAPARVRGLDRRRSRASARRVHPPHQRGARRPARGHGRDDSHVPGQLPLLVGRRGRLRLVAEALFNELEVDGFFMEWDDERSGGFEPAAVRAEGEGGRARPRDDQARRARAARRAEAEDRGGRPVRRRRPALPLAAVRLRLDGGGQRADRRRRARETAPRRRDRARRSGAELAT